MSCSKLWPSCPWYWLAQSSILKSSLAPASPVSRSLVSQLSSCTPCHRLRVVSLPSAQAMEQHSCVLTTFTARLHVLAANFDGKCGPANEAYTNVNGLVACYHYLQNLGTRQCTTPGSNNPGEFCHSGDASVTGQSLVSGTASSYWYISIPPSSVVKKDSPTYSSDSRDVATGLLWVIDHCTRPDQSCAGKFLYMSTGTRKI